MNKKYTMPAAIAEAGKKTFGFTSKDIAKAKSRKDGRIKGSYYLKKRLLS